MCIGLLKLNPLRREPGVGCGPVSQTHTCLVHNRGAEVSTSCGPPARLDFPTRHDMPTERATERPTDQPTGRPPRATAPPIAPTTTRGADRSTDRATDRPSGHPAYGPNTDGTIDRRSDPPTDRTSGRPHDRPGDRSSDLLSDRTGSRPSERPTGGQTVRQSDLPFHYNSGAGGRRDMEICQVENMHRAWWSNVCEEGDCVHCGTSGAKTNFLRSLYETYWQY